jgi:hypothetical protein
VPQIVKPHDRQTRGDDQRPKLSRDVSLLEGRADRRH